MRKLLACLLFAFSAYGQVYNPPTYPTAVLVTDPPYNAKCDGTTYRGSAALLTYRCNGGTQAGLIYTNNTSCTGGTAVATGDSVQ